MVADVVFGSLEHLLVPRRLADVLQLDHAHLSPQEGPVLVLDRRNAGHRGLGLNNPAQRLPAAVDALDGADDGLLELGEVDFRGLVLSGAHRQEEVESSAADFDLDGVTKKSKSCRTMRAFSYQLKLNPVFKSFPHTSYRASSFKS